jgi:hypothetical protein
MKLVANLKGKNDENERMPVPNKGIYTMPGKVLKIKDI